MASRPRSFWLLPSQLFTQFTRLKWLFQQILKGSPQKPVMSFQKQSKTVQTKHTKNPCWCFPKGMIAMIQYAVRTMMIILEDAISSQIKLNQAEEWRMLNNGRSLHGWLMLTQSKAPPNLPWLHMEEQLPNRNQSPRCTYSSGTWGYYDCIIEAFIGPPMSSLHPIMAFEVYLLNCSVLLSSDLNLTYL